VIYTLVTLSPLTGGAWRLMERNTISPQRTATEGRR
jgi:hypothetical protein